MIRRIIAFRATRMKISCWTASFSVLFALAHATALGQTSPKGTFRIESEDKAPPPGIEGTDVADFVVSTTDPKVREPLDDHPDTTRVSYVISPDEKWIYEDKYYGHKMTGGELYKRGEGLKFEPLNSSRSFGEQAWRFFGKQEHIDADEAPAEPGDEGIIDFVAWSADSARLLVDLRGGVFGGGRERGVYRWYLYFNTRSEQLELSEYLRRLNKDAWKRWKSFFNEDGGAHVFAEAVCAEPLTELPAEAESKKRFEEADKRVNDLFRKLVDHQEKQLQQSRGETTASATQRQIYERQLQSTRDAQRDWIKARELGAKLYADTGAKASAPRRYWQHMAESAAARARDLESQLSASDGVGEHE
jgi:hypothetical protein